MLTSFGTKTLKLSLSQTFASSFTHPYLPHTEATRQHALDVIGVKSVDELFAAIPETLRNSTLDLPGPKSESEVLKTLSDMAAKNMTASESAFFIGGGLYRHQTSVTVDALIQRSEFLTSYTPYQPEVSQGTLQALFEFQSMMATLTGMEVSNASLYDVSTGVAEAALMASRVTRKSKVIMSPGVHKHYREILDTYSHFQGKLKVHEVDHLGGGASASNIEALIASIDKKTACVVVQNPDFYGNVNDLTALADACHANKALLVVAVPELLSLGAIKNPGEMGADIVIADGGSLSGGMGFGGPRVGVLTCREKHMRQMPGRVIGMTQDADGNRAFCITLATREQHIRREKATSNICTASSLAATALTIQLALFGEKGFKDLARINHAKACETAARLTAEAGCRVLTDCFFNEFAVQLPGDAEEAVHALAKQGILAGVPARSVDPEAPADVLLIAATEMTSDLDIDKLVMGLHTVFRK
eukprot:gnl/Dysnectes_brevis/245_a276_4505.p1 GENE.gnl/Dysnectes_brevis/245_a276_4505~~gnl/Dysnectes_brevis/245_a276_4505.p1  ORF type:complete len:476 (-),score=210.62 gnl/Dysnectes_brevis/245_a276_4505:32-1459(-)